VRVLEYLDAAGRSAFRRWFDDLDQQAAAKVAVALTRIGLGNLSNAKGLNGMLFEYRIDFGPGYRIYFGREGDEIVILLGGGTKRRQQRDIEMARLRWADYRQRRKEQR
jgi:putative addiction module killer protein